MTRTVTFMELRLEDSRRPPEAKPDPRHDTAPRGDVLMEQILENLNATPPAEVWRRIASLPNIRRGKVLHIRRQLTEGTYEVADRLSRVIDRMLEAIIA